MIEDRFLPDKMPQGRAGSNDNFRTMPACQAAAQLLHHLRRLPEIEALVVINLVNDEIKTFLHQLKERRQ